MAASQVHPDFSLSLTEQALETLAAVFHRLASAFTAGEERRLGEVIVSGILSGKLKQSEVAKWLSQLEFPLNEITDYIRLATFEVFLAYIYFHFFEKIELENGLKSALLKYL